MYINDNNMCVHPKSRPLVGRRPPAVTSVHDLCNLRTYTHVSRTQAHGQLIDLPPRPTSSCIITCAQCAVYITVTSVTLATTNAEKRVAYKITAIINIVDYHDKSVCLVLLFFHKSSGEKRTCDLNVITYILLLLSIIIVVVVVYV